MQQARTEMTTMDQHGSPPGARSASRRLCVYSLAASFLSLGGAGCASSLTPATGDLSIDLRHQDPRIRIDAAIKAVAEQRLELAAQLVENLSDRDGAVRMFSAAALRKLTGRDFGYKPHGTIVEREEAVGRWRTWLVGEAARAGDHNAPAVSSGMEANL